MDKSSIALSWLALAAALGIGEITLIGSFFLAPLAVGALVAAIVALFAGFVGSFIAFVLVSVLAFLALRPLSAKLDKTPEDARGLGGNRLKESTGVVSEQINAGPGQSGQVMIGAESWRAVSAAELAIAEGTKVKVVDVAGTTLSVEPT